MAWEIPREGSSELGSAIHDKFRRKTKAFPDMITIQVSRTLRGDIGMARGKNGHFGHVMIHKDSNSIKHLRWGKGDDEVHGCSRKWGGIFSRSDGQEGNGSTIGLIFCGLANSTTINIVKDEPTHPRPKELSANEVISFVPTRMSSGREIMEQMDKIAP